MLNGAGTLLKTTKATAELAAASKRLEEDYAARNLK